MSVTEPPLLAALPAQQWWSWITAVQQVVSDPGVTTTALLWATHAVSWSSNSQAPIRGTGVAELVERAHSSDRTVRRHLAELVRLGLLRQVQRNGRRSKNRYEAVLPLRAAVNPGQLSDLSSVQHRSPVTGVDGQHRSPVTGVETGGEVQQRSRVTGVDGLTPVTDDRSSIQSLFLSEKRTSSCLLQEPESSAMGQTGGGGGGTLSGDEITAVAADELLRAVPQTARRGRIATGEPRRRLDAVTGRLLAAGFTLAELVRYVIQDGQWDHVQHAVAVLTQRLESAAQDDGVVLRRQITGARAAQDAAQDRIRPIARHTHKAPMTDTQGDPQSDTAKRTARQAAIRQAVPRDAWPAVQAHLFAAAGESAGKVPRLDQWRAEDLLSDAVRAADLNPALVTDVARYLTGLPGMPVLPTSAAASA